jgi:transposase InsO family protein
LTERIIWTEGAPDGETEELERGADRGADGARQRPRTGLQRGRELRAKLKDECLKLEIFYHLREAQVIIGAWKEHYNRFRPHSALGYRPPAPLTFEILPR